MTTFYPKDPRMRYSLQILFVSKARGYSFDTVTLEKDLIWEGSTNDNIVDQDNYLHSDTQNQIRQIAIKQILLSATFKKLSKTQLVVVDVGHEKSHGGDGMSNPISRDILFKPVADDKATTHNNATTQVYEMSCLEVNHYSPFDGLKGPNLNKIIFKWKPLFKQRVKDGKCGCCGTDLDSSVILASSQFTQEYNISGMGPCCLKTICPTSE